MDEILAAENEVRRREGRDELTRSGLEARLVGDERERSRLLRRRAFRRGR